MEPSTSTATRRAAVVINPMKSPDGDFKSDFLGLCEAEGWAAPLWLETTAEDPGSGQSKQALEAGVDVVIAAGGDGTVRCVAGVLAGTGTPMGLLPLGTGNLLARNLGIGLSDPLSAARDVLNGTNTAIDVVNATLDHAQERHLFLVAAGLGYDASIMADTNEDLKDRVGWLAYVEAGIRNLPGKGVKATIAVDGRNQARRRVRSVMVGNCGKLMGGVAIFPDASVTDGALDLLILSPRGKFGWLGVIAGIFGRSSASNRSVAYFSGRSAEITLESELDFQLDGDQLGAARHLLVTVDPQALTIRMAAAAT
ncbi:MAG: diacylglycerol kinase family protein [Specibacter sp.]